MDENSNNPLKSDSVEVQAEITFINWPLIAALLEPESIPGKTVAAGLDVEERN